MSFSAIKDDRYKRNLGLFDGCLNQRVELGDILGFIYVICNITPGIHSGMLSAFSHLAAIGVVLLLIGERYRPSVIIFASGFYFFVLLVSTYFADSPEANMSFIVRYVKLFLILIVIDWRIDSKRIRNPFVSLLFYAVLLLTFVDAWTVYKYPNGLRRSEYGIPEWFFGNKNNRMYWYVLPTLLAAWRSRYMNRIHGFVLVSALGIFSEIVMLMCDSATSAGAFFFVLIGCVLFTTIKGRSLPRVNALIPVAVFLVMNILLIVGSTEFLRPIVMGLFGKNMTFTDRVTIWSNALGFIAKKPIIGQGFLGNDYTSAILGRHDWVNCHNQVLDTLFIGGIVLFAALLLVFIALCMQTNRVKRCDFSLLFCLVLGGLLAQMLFEQTLTMTATWIVFVLLFKFAQCLADEGKMREHPYSVQAEVEKIE